MLQEIMYHRVDFIHKPWYDDHFDIPTERQRIGKALTMIAGAGSDLLSRGCLLVGLALYEKIDRVMELMTQWTDGDSVSPAVTASVVRTSCVNYICICSTPMFLDLCWSLQDLHCTPFHFYCPSNVSKTLRNHQQDLHCTPFHWPMKHFHPKYCVIRQTQTYIVRPFTDPQNTSAPNTALSDRHCLMMMFAVNCNQSSPINFSSIDISLVQFCTTCYKIKTL